MQNKPSKEELDEKIREASEISEEELTTPAVEETSPEEDITEEVVEETPKVEEPIEEKLTKSLEEKDKKLSASARESQKLYAKNRVINKALIEAEETPEPTEDELKGEYSNWDEMSDLEKHLAKETVISRNWRKTIAQAKEQATKIEKWHDSVDEFVGNPKTLLYNPDLEGKIEEFKEFATKEENNSVPFTLLVSAFLFEQGKSKTSNKGKMFETGTGGPNQKPQPKSDKLSLEESRQLRLSDYNKWKEYVSAGKIDLSV